MPRVTSTLFNGTTSQPKLSPQAATQGTRGLQGLLSNVGDAAVEIHGAFAELEAKEEDAELEDIESRYRRRRVEDFDAWTLENHDTNAWLEKSQDVHKRFVSEIDGERSRSPEFKKRIHDRLSKLNYADETRLIGRAARLKGEKINQQYKSNIDYAIDTGDSARARELNQKWKDSGYASEQANLDIARHIDRTEELQAYKDIIETDPRSLIGKKRPSSLHESDWERIQKTSRNKISQNEREASQRISSLLDGGQITDRKELESLLKNNSNISEERRNIFLHHYDQDQPVDLETKTRLIDQLNELKGQLDGGEITLDDYTKGHHDIAGEIYAIGAKDGSGGLRKRAHDLDPAQWSNGAPAPKTGAKRLEEDFSKLSTQWSKDGGYGHLTGDEGNADTNFEATVLRQKVERSLEDWIERNPNATLEELSDKFRETVNSKLSDGDGFYKQEVSGYEDYSDLQSSYQPGDSGLLPPVDGATPEAGPLSRNEHLLLPPLDNPTSSGIAQSGELGEFTYQLEGGVGTTGKGDKYGQVPEFFGMNKKADGANYEKVMSTYRSQGERAAKKQAWEILSSNAKKEGFFSSNPKVQELLVGVHHHRGGGGLTKILQMVTDTQLTGQALTQEFEKATRSPGFSVLWKDARERQENQAYGSRPQFRKGLTRRWAKEADLIADA